MVENELESIVEQEVENYYKEYSDSYDHEEMTDYAPFGDTEVPVDTYITEESADRCAEDFKEEFDLDTFLQSFLIQSEDFQQLILNILQKRNLIK